MPEEDSEPIFMRYIKGGCVLLKAQILGILFSLIAYLLAFMFLTKNAIGFSIYSVISMLVTFLFIYSDAERIAKDDLKTYHNYEHYPIKGVVLEILPVIITTIILISWKIVTSFFNATNTGYVVIQTIFIFYNFPYRGIMQINGNHLNSIVYFLMYLLPIVSAALGYFAGMKNFSLYNKFIYPLIYKKRNKK